MEELKGEPRPSSPREKEGNNLHPRNSSNTCLEYWSKDGSQRIGPGPVSLQPQRHRSVRASNWVAARVSLDFGSEYSLYDTLTVHLCSLGLNDT